MYDPSIGQESLTSVDVIGVLIGHVLFGVAATLLIDWSWIPLSPQQKASARSLKEIKKTWGWNEETSNNANPTTIQSEKSLIEDSNEQSFNP